MHAPGPAARLPVARPAAVRRRTAAGQRPHLDRRPRPARSQRHRDPRRAHRRSRGRGHRGCRASGRHHADRPRRPARGAGHQRRPRASGRAADGDVPQPARTGPRQRRGRGRTCGRSQGRRRLDHGRHRRRRLERPGLAPGPPGHPAARSSGDAAGVHRPRHAAQYRRATRPGHRPRRGSAGGLVRQRRGRLRRPALRVRAMAQPVAGPAAARCPRDEVDPAVRGRHAALGHHLAAGHDLDPAGALRRAVARLRRAHPPAPGAAAAAGIVRRTRRRRCACAASAGRAARHHRRHQVDHRRHPGRTGRAPGRALPRHRRDRTPQLRPCAHRGAAARSPRARTSCCCT